MNLKIFLPSFSVLYSKALRTAPRCNTIRIESKSRKIMLEFETEREKLIYLALALDTEGCIGLYKNRSERIQRHCKVGYTWDVVVDVCSTSREFPEFLKSQFGGGGISTDKHSKPRRLRAYHWRMNKTQMTCLLPKAIPFMVKRKKQAELLLEAISIIEEIKGRGRKDNPRLDEIEKELRRLNANKKPSRRIH